jgi:hypothetical protein
MRLRLITLALFAIFALLELSDAFGLVQTLAQPEPVAAMLNISVGEEIMRAVILLALSVTITIASALTVLGTCRRSRLIYSWVIVTVSYVLYGLYQVASALLQSKAPAIAATGAVYLLLAAAAYSFGRQASRTLRSQTTSHRGSRTP